MSVAENSAAGVEQPPPPARGWPRARIAGTLLLALWAALALGIVLHLFSAFDPALFARFGPAYLHGLWVTMMLVGISMVLGGLLSVPIAYARMSSSRLLSAPAYAYVYFFRGTPLLAQTFLIYYGLGSFRLELEAIGLWGFFREAWYCGLLSLTLNTAAYTTEILRLAASLPVSRELERVDGSAEHDVVGDLAVDVGGIDPYRVPRGTLGSVKVSSVVSGPGSTSATPAGPCRIPVAMICGRPRKWRST